MISISRINDSIVFESSDNQFYLQDGKIECPVNSLLLITDESSLATFKRAATNDILLSCFYSDLGMTKTELEDWFAANACGGMGGSSIVEIYVGSSYDTVDEDSGVVTKYQVGDIVSGHVITQDDMQNLIYVYVNSQRKYSLTKVDINDFLDENEFKSGVTVNNHIVVGVVDPRSEKVITAYNASGTPTTSASVLSVNESGFTTNHIQDAIDAKFNLVKNYEISGGTNITVNADTSNPLVTKLEIVNDLNLRNGNSAFTGSVQSLGSTAFGDNSLAFGRNCFASGTDSIALGTDGKAYNNHTLAMNGIAEGLYSIAMGFNTIASGNASVALCDNTVALNNNELACGSFNESHTSADASGSTLFSIGGGTGDSNRHNAFEVMKNGDIYVIKDGNTVLLQDELAKYEKDDNNGILFEEGSSDLVILDGGSY